MAAPEPPIERGDPALAVRAIDFVRSQQVTFCAGRDKLDVLLAAVSRCAERLPGGVYIEAGVAMGGSAIVIAAAKPKDAPLYLFDVYEMLPAPSEADGERASAVYAAFEAGTVSDPVSRKYFDNRGDLLSLVKENFAAMGLDPAAYNVDFRKGLFQDTLKIDEPVAFCHVDCDWHDSVVLCIESVAPHMLPGGIIVFDDYSSFEGCREAVDRWLDASPQFTVIHKGWTLAAQRSSEGPTP